MADEKKEAPAESGGGWGEFALDKGTDFVIAFAGLYLAIWVQDGVDARKEKESYLQSLQNFKTELTFNKAQGVDTKPIEQSLSDLQVLAAYYQTEAQIFSAFDRPAQAEEIVGEIEEMTTFLDAELVKIQPGAKLDDVFERSGSIKPVKLAPHYETQIWKVYIAGGVNIAQSNAKNPDLAKELGGLYSELASVETRVRDLETYYNDRFIPRFAEINAASEDVEGYWYDDETGEALADEALLTKLGENQADIAEAASDLDVQLTDNYVELQVATAMLQAKVDDLNNPETGLLAAVAKRVDKVNALIDEELKKF